MTAELFLAIGAIKATVGCRRKTLGVEAVRDLPAQKERNRASEKAVGIKARNEYERREHHCKIPIIDAAGGTAAVLHEPCLERAEEENADNVAHRIGDGDQDQNPAVKDSQKVEKTEHGVECKPDEGDERGGSRGLIHGLALSVLWRVISCKLLLTAHAFEPGWEETEQHFDDKGYPYDRGDDQIIRQHLGSLQNICSQNGKKQSGTTEKFDVM